MANQEGIDIIIKATDQYTKTINNITASNELMGKSVKSVQKELDATTKLWTTLRVQGLDPASASMKVLKMNAEQLTFTLNSMKTAANGAGGAITSSASNLKKSNQQWTNLALVVQDLPFGFRGIQNNLPALIGSVAGAGGALYFAGSAIIALFTAWDLGLFGTTKKTKELKDETDSLISSMSQEATRVNSLISVLNNESETRERKNRAIKELQKINPDIFKGLKLEGDKVKDLNKFYNAYIENLKNAILLKQDELELEKLIKEDLKRKPVLSTTSTTNPLATGKKLLEANVGILRSSDNLTGQIDNKNKKIINNLGEQNKRLTKREELLARIAKRSGSVELGTDGSDKPAKEVKDTYLKDFSDAIKEEQRLFKENLDNQLSYAEGNDAKKVEILGKAMSDLISWYNQGIIEESFYQNTLADLYKQTYNLKVGLLKKEQTEKDKIAKENEKIDNRELQNSLDALKIQSEVATKIANSSGKATSSERIAILEEYKNSLYQLASVGGYTAEQFDKIDDALRNVDAAIKGSKDNLKDYEVTWTDTLNVINKAILDFVVNSVVSLSESLGQLLAGEKVQPFVALTEILASALTDIGKSLITLAITQKLALLSLSDPLKWPIALAAGIAAVAAGAALKSSLRAKSTPSSGGSTGNIPAFANGGIISGPTLGLMGEYPGASSNPEVVAPLDKLKDMLGGGGGGTFVLRGQDLLLSVNRAQKASNIKGQTISLA
jgi:hypothetical protein